MRLILSSLLLLLPLAAFADADLTCTNGYFRSMTNGQVTTTTHTYCYDATKTQLYSRECRDKRCKAFQSENKFKFQDLVHEVGNPGFTLCRKLDGHPEILEFKVKEEWYKLDRCLFKDGSFVNSDQLMKYYLRTRKGLHIQQ